MKPQTVLSLTTTICCAGSRVHPARGGYRVDCCRRRGGLRLCIEKLPVVITDYPDADPFRLRGAQKDQGRQPKGAGDRHHRIGRPRERWRR
jgi:hypothetical protein